MSAATTAAPTVIRSSSRRQQSYTTPGADRPHRTSSTTARTPTTPATPATPQRADSNAHGHHRTSSQQAGMTGVARRDYETTNVARPTSRRSSSRDADFASPPPPYQRSDSMRSNHRSSSRPGHSRYNSDAPATNPIAHNAGQPIAPAASSRSQGDTSSQGTPGTTKRRTTIAAQTGQWALGKRIGEGSMGKVKLAKSLETGEQVCPPTYSTRENAAREMG